VLDEAGLRRSGRGRAIVYCATRKKTEMVADELKSAGFAVGHYHAGRTALARERSQRAFATARTRVLVATSAFGMGIDYPDVRVIVHFQSPGSLEAYYQEAGRAGRDGEPGRCILLFGAGDMLTQRRLMERGRSSIAAQTRAEDALAAIETYVHTAACRQVQLCAHFEPSGEHAKCTTCDVCTGVVAEELHEPVEMRASPRPSKPRMLTPRAERKQGRRPPWLAKNTEGRAERQRDRRPRTNSVTLELDTYRKRMARQLKWKAYMIFQQKTIAAIAEQRPLSRDALLRIPGLGPAKIARFGDDIIAVVRRHSE
jgi:superfamily II DNA helicase RecQ